MRWFRGLHCYRTKGLSEIPLWPVLSLIWPQCRESQAWRRYDGLALQWLTFRVVLSWWVDAPREWSSDDNDD